jgi:hypothetical protein
MRYPEASYLNTPVGEQLLQHYASRDRIRHATALFPLRLADLGNFLRELFGASSRNGRLA